MGINVSEVYDGCVEITVSAGFELTFSIGLKSRNVFS